MSPSTALYAPIDLILAPLYAVSLLALANSTDMPAAACPGAPDAAFLDLDLELPGGRRRRARVIQPAEQLVPNRLGVRIEVRRERWVDDASDASCEAQVRRARFPGLLGAADDGAHSGGRPRLMRWGRRSVGVGLRFDRAGRAFGARKVALHGQLRGQFPEDTCINNHS